MPEPASSSAPTGVPRVAVLVNPSAGLGVGGELVEGAHLRGFDVDAVVLRAADATALVELARAELEAGLDAIVVQGGDGMVHLGVGLVAGTDVPLGIVPTGSGNDFARAAGLDRRDPHAALASVLRAMRDPSAGIRRVDAMRVTVAGRTTWAANSVNIGFDSVVNRRANELRRLPGTLRYLVALAQVARRFETVPFRIGLDGAPPVLRPGPLVTIGNGPTVGGGIRLLPDADVADGALDVLLVDPLSRAGLVSLFPLAAVGQHRRLPMVELARARSIVVEAPDDVLVSADGEPLGSGTTRVECVPGAWRLLRG